MRVTALVAIVSAPRCFAWVATAQTLGLSWHEIQTNGGLSEYVWTMPKNPLDQTGLGGGLTYNWDSNLCNLLLPHFGERYVWGLEFVACKDLRASVARAFSSWVDNHPLIHFHDVTERCLYDNSTQFGGSYCALSEIFITNNTFIPKASPNQAATTLLWTNDANYKGTFYYTNGLQAASAKNSIARATIGINPSICWYLDSTFCSYFHSLKSSFGEGDRACPSPMK